MTSIPLSEMESSPSAKFERFGDAYSGRVVGAEKRPQTDLNSGAARTFSSGTPMEVWVITIETANGERLNLWASGGNIKATEGSGERMLTAIGTACRAAGATDGLHLGDELAVAYTGRGDSGPGKAPAKLYTAQVRPAPATAVGPTDLFTQ